MRALPKVCPTARDRLAFGSLSRFRFGSGASSCGVTAAALASLSLSAHYLRHCYIPLLRLASFDTYMQRCKGGDLAVSP